MAKVTAKIYLTDGTGVEFGKESIQSIDSLSQSTSDASSLSYDVLSSTGSLQIVDINGNIEDYIKQGLIDTSSLQIELYFNDKLVRKHISSDNNYDNNTKVLTTNLTDSLSVWDIIKFNGYYYPEKEETAYEMLKNILVSVGYQEDYINGTMLSDYTINADGVPVTIKEYLESIKIQYPYLPVDTLRATIDKFCSLAQLDVLLDNNGDIKFTTARPILVSKNSVIQIPYHKQYSDLSYSVILKNKYDAVEIEKYNVKSEVNYNTQIYSSSSNSPVSFSNEASDAQGFVSGILGGKCSVAYAYLKQDYYSDSYTIPKRSNYNLYKVLKVYSGKDKDGNNNIKSLVNYNQYDTSLSMPITISGLSGNYTSSYTLGDLSSTILEETNGSSEINREETTSIKKQYTVTSLDGVITVNATATLQNQADVSIAEVFEDDENFYSEFTVVTGETTRKLGGDSAWNQYTIQTTGSGIQIAPNSVTITFYGDRLEISFTPNSASSENINLAINPIGVDTSELFSDKTTIDGKEITEIVKDNILSDYSNGISNGTITISCSDFYNQNGDRVVNSANGELISVGDIVQVEGDDRYWRVTGSKFRKEGCPFNDLEVMEVKPIIMSVITINMSNSPDLNGTISLPIVESSDFTVDWGDGNVETYNDTTNILTHTYSDADFSGDIKIYKGWNGVSLGENANLNDNAKTITKVEYSEYIITISDFAFNYCTNMTEIVVGNNVKSIGENSFGYCRNLEKVELPDTVTNISDTAFWYTAITKIPNMKNVENIGNMVFGYCNNIKEIKPTDNIGKIGSSMFYGCEGLEKVYLQDGISTIESAAFGDCYNLKEVILPSSVTQIREVAFYGCDKLDYIKIFAEEPPILTDVASIPENIPTIYIPRGTIDKYSNQTNWNLFSSKFVEF